eukprot:scaffold261089_cov35-Tisochrysis_lutea.AAC.1
MGWHWENRTRMTWLLYLLGGCADCGDESRGREGVFGKWKACAEACLPSVTIVHGIAMFNRVDNVIEH